ncbi:hypothetical protein [Enterobacter kobei]|uniref:hypothetical protein n=1 Tax=Enterobacter kobei TaxID=208224 RepID=UPI00207C803B|nr:hypothetical protein [Enterobacter kobei]
MSTITKEFTKEQLQQIEAAAKEVLWPVVWSEKKAREHFSEKITPKVVLKLARIALASLEAEAVGEVVLGEYDDCGCHPDARVVCIAADGQADWENFKDGTRLYAAPPSPAEIDERDAFNAWNNDENLPIAGVGAKNAAWLAWQARAKLYAPPSPVSDEDLLHMAASAIDDLLSNKDRSGAGVWADIPAKLRRAAMLQGADGNSPVIPDCSCHACRPVTFADSRFVVCPVCGNKRCPHANDHRNACTGSNEPGQEGSAYPAAPQQEAKP